MLTRRSIVQDFVLEHPSEVMGDEYGIETRSECRVDIGFRAVADHPGGWGFAGMMSSKGDVGLIVFLGQDFDGGEVGGQTGAAELVGLLGGISLGDENEAVPGGK